MPTRILMFEEKNEDRYFLYNTVEERNAIAFYIISERYKNDFLCLENKKEIIKNIEMCKKQIENLQIDLKNVNNELSKMSLESLLKEAIKNLEYRERDLFDINTIESMIENKDHAKAWRILNLRRDYEYEGFEDFEPERISLEEYKGLFK